MTTRCPHSTELFCRYVGFSCSVDFSLVTCCRTVWTVRMMGAYVMFVDLVPSTRLNLRLNLMTMKNRRINIVIMINCCVWRVEIVGTKPQLNLCSQDKWLCWEDWLPKVSTEIAWGWGQGISDVLDVTTEGCCRQSCELSYFSWNHSSAVFFQAGLKKC